MFASLSEPKWPLDMNEEEYVYSYRLAECLEHTF